MQRMATPPAKNTMYDQQQPAGEPGAWRTDTVCATNMGMHPAAAQGPWSTGICDCCAEPGQEMDAPGQDWCSGIMSMSSMHETVVVSGSNMGPRQTGTGRTQWDLPETDRSARRI